MGKIFLTIEISSIQGQGLRKNLGQTLRKCTEYYNLQIV